VTSSNTFSLALNARRSCMAGQRSIQSNTGATHARDALGCVAGSDDSDASQFNLTEHCCPGHAREPSSANRRGSRLSRSSRLPTRSEWEGPLSEAAKEILKEFAKCEVEGKSVEACLSEEPPPPQLSELSFEDLSRLRDCLGSSDLAATRDRWNSCVAFVP